MPTVDQLTQQIADETGLDFTTDSAVLLRAINRAYRRICSETDCLKGTATTLAGDATTVDVSLSTLTNLLSIDSVYLVTGGVYSPIPQSTVAEVQTARTQSGVRQYAYEGGALLLDGPVGTSNSLYIRWAARPTALVAAGAEATITGIDPAFHEDLLAGLAMVHILEGYEGDEQRASYYRTLALDAMARFKKYLVDRGGNELPNGRYGATHFTTPSPLTIR